MPQYYFHLRNDLDVPDPEGQDLPDFERACAEAYRLTRDMVSASAVERGMIDLTHYIEVLSENGESMLKVEFGEAVRITRDGNSI